jgi:Protein of unknown function (DUF3043)
VQLSPFRRKSSESDSESVAQTTEESVTTGASTRPRARTASKRELGQVTPKRKAGGRKVEAPPANRREAMKRMREQQRQSRAEARAGMLAGKEEFLPQKDKGPERRLVRDIVDSRRNLVSYLLFVLLGVTVITYAAPNPATLLYVNLLLYVTLAAMVVDSFLLTRRIKKIMTKRFPKAAKPPRSHYVYSITRAMQLRRLRLPSPMVKVGDRVE